MAKRPEAKFGLPTPRLLAAARALADLSQGELAERSGVNKSVVARYEAGMTAMRSDKLVRLVAVLEECGVRFVGSPTSQFIGLMVENPLLTTQAAEPLKGGADGA